MAEHIRMSDETSPKAKKLGRRSALMSIARRQSKSMGVTGIPFEDQLSAIDKTAPARDKLRSLIQICVSTTLRLQKEQAQDESNEEVSDAVEEVVSDIFKKDWVSKFMGSQEAQGISDKIEELNKYEKTKKDLVAPRVRKMKEYILSLQREADEWKSFLNIRKGEYEEARAERKGLLAKKQKISEITDDKLTDESAWVNLLQVQEEKLILRENEIMKRIRRVKAQVDDTSVETNRRMEKAIKLANTLQIEKSEVTMENIFHSE